MKKIIFPIFLLFFVLGLTAQTCLIDTTTWRATPTSDNATIVIPIRSMPTIANQPLPAGTLIGVFNHQQQLCGVATWTGTTNIALTVYGFEAGSKGLLAGEAFKFRIKLPDNRVLTNVQATYAAVSGIYTIQGNYGMDGIAGVSGLVAHYPATLDPNVNITSISCYGFTNGSLSVTPSGGTAPYRYAWSGSANSTDSVLRNLAIGNYRLEITDHRGCSTTGIYTITQPDSLRLLMTATPSTVGGATGTATVVATGGTPNYRYAWSQRPDTTANIRNLAPNIYTVTVTDAHACIKRATISILTNGLRDDLSQKNIIRVFPNPVLRSEPLNISIQFIHRLSQSPPIQITLRDALGRRVENIAENIVVDTEKAISIQDLPAGIYFMVFQSGDLQTVKPILCTQ